MRFRFMRSFFGCCQLRTAVIIIAILDLIFGLYEIVDFAMRVFFDLNGKEHTVNHTFESNRTSVNKTLLTNSTVVRSKPVNFSSGHGSLYDNSAFAVIVIGCIDLFIASFLLYVTLLRRYDLRVVVFVGAIWSFVIAFLNFISFGITLGLNLIMEFVLFLIAGLVEICFGYIILSYFHYMTVIVERGLDEVNMAYFAEDNSVVTHVPSDMQMDEANDERPIIDDQDDFPEFGDDGRIPLT